MQPSLSIFARTMEEPDVDNVVVMMKAIQDCYDNRGTVIGFLLELVIAVAQKSTLLLVGGDVLNLFGFLTGGHVSQASLMINHCSRIWL